MNRKKKYIPSPKYNPIVMGKKLEKLGKELEYHKNLLLAVNRANDLHVEYLSNFVRHDMKNAIQGIDGTLYNAKKNKAISDEVQNQLDTALKLLHASLDSFTRLIPSSQAPTTTLPKVLNAVETLSRSEAQNKGIEMFFEYDRQSDVSIHYSFQSLVQVLHNLVINAYNALSEVEEKKMMVKGEISEDRCTIAIYDNGINIDSANNEAIFHYGYSTTGGSGVGLFHAKSVVEEMSGSITVDDSDLAEYTKCFKIVFNPRKVNYE